MFVALNFLSKIDPHIHVYIYIFRKRDYREKDINREIMLKRMYTFAKIDILQKIINADLIT